MKEEKIFESIADIDEKYVAEARTKAAKKKRPVWVRWAAMAACLCLIVGGIIMLSQPNDGTKDIRPNDGTRVISHYDANSGGSYPAPRNGLILFEAAVREARDIYRGKDVIYQLALDIFENEETVSREKEEEEYQRLITEGYELYSAEKWTYQGKGEKKYITVVVGYFTEDQLANFKNNSGYGYFFYFAKNGDGSEILVNEDDLIADFPTNRS